MSLCLWTVLFVRNTVYIFRTPFALFLHQDIHFWTEEIFRSVFFPKYNMNERNILWDLFLHVWCHFCCLLVYWHLIEARNRELVFLFFLLGHQIWFSGWCKETMSVRSARLWFLFSSLSVKFYNLHLVFLLNYLLLPFFRLYFVR